MKRLVFDISAHGYGHITQTACVIDALQESFPEASVIVRSAYSENLLGNFLKGPVHFESLPTEPTLEMRGPLDVDRDASSETYRNFHASWETHLLQRVVATASLRPDLVVCNAPYVSLAAAARLDIPSVALCSLNWFDMVKAYCEPNANIADVILRSYESALAFLQPAPHMPMPDLANRRSIGPIARRGCSRPNELRARLGLPPCQRIVLVTFGGVSGSNGFPVPLNRDVFWLVQGNVDVHAPHARSTRELDLPFIDILASVDAVLCKDGYSTTVEAACCGTRILMLTRDDWPETPYLVDWSQRNACFESCPIDVDQTTFTEALARLFDRDWVKPAEPMGVRQAVDIIASAAGLN